MSLISLSLFGFFLVLVYPICSIGSLQGSWETKGGTSLLSRLHHGRLCFPGKHWRRGPNTKGTVAAQSMHKHARTGHPMPPAWLRLQAGRRNSQGKPNNLLSLREEVAAVVVVVVVVNWRGGSGVGGGINPAVLPAASQPALGYFSYRRWVTAGNQRDVTRGAMTTAAAATDSGGAESSTVCHT